MAAYRAAVEVAVGLRADADRITRLTAGSTSWVYDLPVAGVVLIVARPGRSPADLAGRLTAARLLSQRLPFVTPLEPSAGPIATSVGLDVTAWQRVTIRPGPPDWAAVGAAVRTLHDVRPAELAASGLVLVDLHQMADIADSASRLHRSGVLRGRDAATLQDAAARLAAELALLKPHRGVVHGDLHLPNILSTAAGCVLCDTDEIGLAGPDWDLGFLVDPGRPMPLDSAGRADFEAGYGSRLPDPATARTVARAAHLRRTLRQLEIQRPTLRERAWSRARLDAWTWMVRDWSRDLQPVVGQPRLSLVTRRLRLSAHRSAG